LKIDDWLVGGNVKSEIHNLQSVLFGLFHSNATSHMMARCSNMRILDIG
jgi:hypothetical protein